MIPIWTGALHCRGCLFQLSHSSTFFLFWAALLFKEQIISLILLYYSGVKNQVTARFG